MGGNPESATARPTAVRRLTERAKTWLTASPRNAGYAVIVAALLLTIPFGGLAAAPQPDPVSAPGETIAADPWEITLERVIYGRELGGTWLEPFDESQHVVVLATVRNTTDTTLLASELDRSLYIRGLPEGLDGLGSPLEDGRIRPQSSIYTLEPMTGELSALAPGITYEVGISLRTMSRTVPDEVQIEVHKKTYRLASIEERMLWTDEELLTVVTLPTERVTSRIFQHFYEWRSENA